jgi:phosphoserine phosphatase RsbU/P
VTGTDGFGLELDDSELYSEAPCGLLSLGSDGVILRVNDSFLTWTGYRREELVGVRRFVDLLTVGGQLYHETHFMPTLQMQSTARELAFEIVCADGSRMPVLVNGVLKRDDTGASWVVRIAVFLATERREYERELLRAKHRAEQSEAAASLMARTLQATLVPPGLPDIPGLDVGAVYRPAGSGEEVGGDFYDVFQVAVDDWVVAIGDVCGKGVDAAVVTALSRYTCRAASVEHDDPSRVLEIVNEVLLRHESNRHCSVALARVRRVGTTWTMTISLAGHPAGILRRRDSGEATEFGRFGSLLGIFTTTTFFVETCMLSSGDVVVLHTDGVTEGRCGDAFFGEQRLRQLVISAEGAAQDVADVVVGEVLSFQHGNPRDDIAIVVVRVP